MMRYGRYKHGWTSQRGFTLIELLVVIAVIAVLIGVLLPALGAARLSGRSTVCGGRIAQLNTALAAYLNDYDRSLPQKLGPLPEGGESVIGALFGGQRGRVPFYGIDTIGAARRPLNSYVFSGVFPDESSKELSPFPMPVFRSPVDRGAGQTGLPIPGLERTNLYYDFVGSSYTLNDHDLRGDAFSTLVPSGGGKMPYVVQPSKTWVIGTHTIYNYDGDGDRQSYWFGGRLVQANLGYLDGHVRIRVNVPAGVVNETPDYVFGP
jgi:prepilin-type N-terminal cleavage/methylation domain-containing protein/prepilin-type processing-associated H-X9-DG protein